MSRASRIVIAEGLGTMILILGGPGSAIFAGPQIGVLGVSLAFGLSLLCAVYLFGGITGCHINPAVTIAMWSIKRTKAKEVPVYIVGQLIGAALGAVIIWAILDTDKLPKKITGSTTDLFTGASNGFGIEHGFFAFVAVMITEVVLTALFVLVIIGAPASRCPRDSPPYLLASCSPSFISSVSPSTTPRLTRLGVLRPQYSPRVGRLNNCGYS